MSIHLPGRSDSFTGSPDDNIPAALGLSAKQSQGQSLFASLRLQDSGLELNSQPHQIIAGLKEKEAQRQRELDSYYAALLGRLLPRIGATCAQTLMINACNEQIAEVPLKAFESFLSSLRLKFKGVDIDPFQRLFSIICVAECCPRTDLERFNETLADLIYQRPALELATDNPVQQLLQHLFGENVVEPFQLTSVMPKITVSETELKFGRLLLMQRLALDSGVGHRENIQLCWFVSSVFGLCTKPDDEIYTLLLKSYQPGSVCPPAELLFVSRLDSYFALACSVLTGLVLALSYLQRFRPHAPTAKALCSTIGLVKTLFRLGSLLAIRCSTSMTELGRLAQLCDVEFKESWKACKDADCSAMWSYINAGEPWNEAHTGRLMTPPQLGQTGGQLNYGGQPCGLLGSDVWMTLHWAGVHTPSELDSYREPFHKHLSGDKLPTEPALFAQRFRRFQEGLSDHALEVALTSELGVRGPRIVEPEIPVDGPESQPVAVGDPATTLSPEIIEMTLDGDDDWASWTT